MIDVMPGESRILGFENRWQSPAFAAAISVKLPSGQRIRAIPPPFLFATKLEAWNGRGDGDHLRSKDLEDLINLVDGRGEIVSEVAVAPPALRSFVAQEVKRLLGDPRFMDVVDGTVIGYGSGGSGDMDRVDDIVLPRLELLANRSS